MDREDQAPEPLNERVLIAAMGAQNAKANESFKLFAKSASAFVANPSVARNSSEQLKPIGAARNAN